MGKIVIRTLISLAIGAVFVWLAVRGVDFAEVGQVLVQVDPLTVGIYVLLFMAVHLVRVFRWGLLLKPIGQVSFGRLFAVASVGFLALILLPLRLGEFARPILIAERGKIRPSAALATIVMERLVDALVMAALLVTLLFFLEGRIEVPGDLRFWSWIVLGAFLGLLLFLIIAYWRQDTTVAWFKKLMRPLSAKLANRLASTLHSFIGGLRALPDPRLLAAFLGTTMFYWALNGFGMWYLFSTFAGLEGLGLVEGFTVLAVLCVGLMIPAGPGMIGNFHYFVKLGLSLFVAEAVLGSSGVAYAILIHAVQLLQQVVVGVICLFSGHISLKGVMGGTDGVEQGTEPGQGQAS